MIKKLLYASDLDRTLIYSGRFLNEHKTDKEILEFASAAAVAALSKADATSGLCAEAEIQEISKTFKRKEICL